jgi:uncharacterized protein (DUF488 family)
MVVVSNPVWTVGHGNRTAVEFVTLLQSAHISLLVDVRAFPSSKRHPQFSKANLMQTLTQHDIRYRWEGRDLGGLREPKSTAPHIGLDSQHFRGYADHMASAGFRSAIASLIVVAQNDRLAIMCAERDPLQCHRSLIADYLVTRSLQVTHLIEAGKTQAHRLNPLVRKSGENLIYDQIRQTKLTLQ